LLASRKANERSLQRVFTMCRSELSGFLDRGAKWERMRAGWCGGCRRCFTPPPRRVTGCNLLLLDPWARSGPERSVDQIKSSRVFLVLTSEWPTHSCGPYELERLCIYYNNNNRGNTCSLATLWLWYASVQGDGKHLRHNWPLSRPSPVAEVFVLAEPNKWLNRQTTNNPLWPITVNLRSCVKAVTLELERSYTTISTAVIIMGTWPVASYLWPVIDISQASTQSN
jgi:hypothetical protein